jgi:hypothetical protein
VEKGSVWTAIGHGWVAPKRKANALQRMFLIHREHRTAKGNLVKIPKRRQLWEIARQRNETATQRDGNWEESSFLFNVWSHDSSEFLYGEKTSRPRQSCFIFWSNSVLSSRSLKIAGSIPQRFFQRVGVLKTASGFQGEQPLVHRRMWVKEFGKIDS